MKSRKPLLLDAARLAALNRVFENAVSPFCRLVRVSDRGGRIRLIAAVSIVLTFIAPSCVLKTSPLPVRGRRTFVARSRRLGSVRQSPRRSLR
jgi:hypothetical protein